MKMDWFFQFIFLIKNLKIQPIYCFGLMMINYIMCILKILTDLCSIKNHDHVPCSFAYKVVCIDDKFSKLFVVYKGENAAFEFIKAILKEYKYCEKQRTNSLRKI